MNQLDIAIQTLSRAIQTGQIGTPVAARVVAHVVVDHGRLQRLTVHTIEQLGRWFGGPPQRIDAMGNIESGHISTLTSFGGGQTALVSVGTSATDRPLLEAVVWGNRGILSWQPDGVSPAVATEDVEPNLSKEAVVMLQPLQASLESGRAANSVHDTASESHHVSRKVVAQQPPYGVLLVSGDHTHQPGYAESLVADNRCKLIGLTDENDVTPRRSRLNRQMAKRLGIPFLPDLQVALRRDDVHIVSICAEPSRRGKIILQAIEAKKHPYLDKPFATSLADSDAIVAATRNTGVVTNMWSLVRSDTAMRMREAVRSGQLGNLTAFHADLCFAKGPGGTAKLGKPRNETSVPKRYELADSKRELSNVGVYPLVSLLWLTGKRVRRVCATTGNYFFKEHQSNDMEDFGQMLLELDDGMIASISAGRTGWRSHRSYGVNRISLIGRKAAMTFDAHRPRVTVWSDVEPWTAPERDPEDPMGMWGGPKDARFDPQPKSAWITPSGADRSDAMYFLDCVEHGRQSDVSAELAAQTTEILLAAYQSATTGKAVMIPLPRA